MVDQNILEKYLEKINTNKMYRSGPKQNIKIFEPRNPSKTHNKLFKNKQIIYVSNDISYAAGFCFEWSDDEGFKFGRYNNGPWTLEIPKKYKNRLNQKCSMYEVNNKPFKKINIKTPEYYSTEPVKVIKETKFKSCYDCLKKYNVVLKIK
jgi:hypothetical protein